jgi:hypothetical protein
MTARYWRTWADLPARAGHEQVAGTFTPEQLAAAGTPDVQPPHLADLIQRDLGSAAAPAAAGIAGELGPLSRDARRRLACDGLVDLIAIPHGQRDPLYVGRAARTVRGQVWRALITRDRTCTVKGCHRSPAQCQAHHVKHSADGGPTDLTNLVNRQSAGC